MNGFKLIDEIVYNKKISSCAPSGEDIVAIITNFKNVKVSDFTITSIDATGCCFNHCNFDGVYITKGIMRNCSFTGVHFNHMILEHACFKRCQFE